MIDEVRTREIPPGRYLPGGSLPRFDDLRPRAAQEVGQRGVVPFSGALAWGHRLHVGRA
ncbi:hypothetical protein QHF89_17580 [Polyangium sorediatum]|uniref:Uncharacterized protein n=1 Tax=Polyangium sorediatum TaxID=889274 RepID=A0ABT6NSK2_9BACT|nr:hypothetical protein [Polyangium sorediatum]